MVVVDVLGMATLVLAAGCLLLVAGWVVWWAGLWVALEIAGWSERSARRHSVTWSGGDGRSSASMTAWSVSCRRYRVRTTGGCPVVPHCMWCEGEQAGYVSARQIRRAVRRVESRPLRVAEPRPLMVRVMLRGPDRDGARGRGLIVRP